MGSCISFSSSLPPPASTAEETSAQRSPVATAKVVKLDGSMAQFAGPVTAREALGDDNGGRGRAPRFLCGSDELGFDAPARALAADEALQPGQLYFVLPAPMLRRPLSGDDMAALAVRAATALAAEAGLAAGGGGVMSPQRRRTKQQGGAAGNGRRRWWQSTTARVAPLLVVSGSNGKDGPSDGSWSNNDTRGGGLATREAVVHDDGSRTVGKLRRPGAVYRRGARRPPSVPRLSAIAEDDE